MRSKFKYATITFYHSVAESSGSSVLDFEVVGFGGEVLDFLTCGGADFISGGDVGLAACCKTSLKLLTGSSFSKSGD